SVVVRIHRLVQRRHLELHIVDRLPQRGKKSALLRDGVHVVLPGDGIVDVAGRPVFRHGGRNAKLVLDKRKIDAGTPIPAGANAVTAGNDTDDGVVISLTQIQYQ